MKRFILFLLIFALFFPVGKTLAEKALTETEYRTNMGLPDIPEVLNVNTWLECGAFQIRLGGQPLLTKTSSGLKASGDKSFLIVRLGIKNMSEEPVVWLDPQSFNVKEYYINLTGRTYKLNSYMSAKAAQSYNLPAYFTPIQPGAELSTFAVFEVYGEVDGWVLTFSPFTRDMSEADSSIEFTLPKVTRQ